MTSKLESAACRPVPLELSDFNGSADLPFGLKIGHVHDAMCDFLNFLGFVNQQLNTKNIARLETMLMPANFSSMVGEFMKANIPQYCATLASNQYHNGHPDLIPSGRFPGNAVQHSNEGIEVKASRYQRGWQGHNPEDIWLMVFVFDSNRPVDLSQGISPKPFRFLKVVGAEIKKRDWSYSGRSGRSRRTITASVTNAGYQKMMANWIYKDSSL